MVKGTRGSNWYNYWFWS